MLSFKWLGVGRSFGIFKTFYLEIIIGSQEVEKQYRHVPCTLTQFPTIVTSYIRSYKTRKSNYQKLHYQSQKIDFGTIHRPYLDFTTFICTHKVLSNLITRVDSCNHHYNQGKEVIHLSKTPCANPYHPFSVHPFLTPPPILQNVLCFFIFDIFHYPKKRR